MAKHYPYLIIGGGMTADAAARGIRQVDAQRPIGIIGQEPDPPYNRPPLSKGLWKRLPRAMPLSRIWRNTAGLGVDLHLGRAIATLDASTKQVTDDQGEIYTFDKLLMATGGAPVRLDTGAPPVRRLPALDGAAENGRIIYFRTLADYHRLRALAETGKQFIVIGGGFIGSEIAAALAGLGKAVTIIFPETGIGARVLPGEISLDLNDTFHKHDVRVLSGQWVQSVVEAEDHVDVTTRAGETLRADAVVAGLGIRPNVALAEASGLATGNGILVDESMRTTHPDIFASGDVANYYSVVLGKRIRVEHEENANQTGLLAGLGMAGQPGRYEGLSSVYSTLFDIHYDAVGDLNPEHTIVYDWQEPFKKGTAYYMDNGRVRGVLLWNLDRGLDVARRLISDPGPFRATDLIGRISD